MSSKQINALTKLNRFFHRRRASNISERTADAVRSVMQTKEWKDFLENSERTLLTYEHRLGSGDRPERTATAVERVMQTKEWKDFIHERKETDQISPFAGGE